MSNLKDIKEFGCPYTKIQCKSCTWNYADTCNFDFDSYQQGRTDRDREIVESNVFFSNKPIEDIVLNTIKDEREQIIAELEKSKKSLLGRYGANVPLLEMPSYKIAYNNGIEKALEIVRGEK